MFAGRHVAWFSLEQLGALVRRNRADDTVTKAIAKILRADLVPLMTAYCRLAPMPPKASTASTMPPTRNAQSP